MHVAHRLPDVGGTVGEYKIVGFLGAGGLGVVLKAERGGRFFAMKFLDGSKLDGRGKREISILNHLDNPRVVRYVGSDYWPDPAAGYLYIVMEFIPGDTLSVFAEKKNPTARKAVQIILDAASTLGEVHAAGVFHRDLKPANIIIRGAAESPTLIDFGIGCLVGAARLTVSSLPPGTEEFRAPEPIRFHRENKDRTVHYEYGVADELWALAVCFYWLLTDTMPFGERSDDGGVEGLHERILTASPESPHVSNPRAPLVVSALCSRMLDPQPDKRFAHVPELCTTLREAMRRAADDASWDLPLFDPDDPQNNTTADDPERMDPNDSARAVRRWVNRRPRRGRVRPKEVLAPMAVEEEAPQQAAAAPELGAVPVVDPGPATASHGPPKPSRRPFRWLTALAVAVVVVGAVAMLAHVGAQRPGLTAPESTQVALNGLPVESADAGSTTRSVRGNELASTAKPRESLVSESAPPSRAQLPAPPVNAMSPQTTKNENAKSQKPRGEMRFPLKTGPVAAALLAGCTGVGCTATNNQVRTEPPAMTCPQDWRETHKRFNVTAWSNGAVVKGYKAEPGDVVRVKDGPVTLQVGIRGTVGKLPDGTLLLGQWKLGDNRLFGTFTEAKIPGEGTLPVCLAAGLEGNTAYTDEHNKHYYCPPGLGVCLTPGSTPGNVKTNAGVSLVVPTGQP